MAVAIQICGAIKHTCFPGGPFAFLAYWGFVAEMPRVDSIRSVALVCADALVLDRI
jgi:hypothetical protein